MNDQTDAQLLRAYAENRSDPAFAELVRRHVDIVHSAALRMVCDSHLAQDVTQAVFLALASNAAQLTNRPVLPGWLHRTAQNIAAQTVRTDMRRRVREQEAAAMNQLLSAEPDIVWEHIAPQLDTALGELSEADRDALLLRYFERKSASEMAATLGISDEAAQKRVNRAVERLRELFAKRGIIVGANGLAVVITANAVQAAPVGLAVTISTAAALAGTTVAATATAVKTITMTTLQKAVVTAMLAAAVGTGIYEARQVSRLREQNQTLQGQHTEQMKQLQQERDDATNRLARQVNETANLNRRGIELLKLRGEVGTLRQRTNELGKLLQAGSGAAGRNLADNEAPDSPGYTNFPRDSWTFEGFATPEAAIKSFMWAKSVGDTKTVLASGTAELRQEVENAYFKDKSEEERKAILLENVQSVTGVEILKKMALSEDQVILQAHFGGAPDRTYSILTMVKLDGEWKVSSVEERTGDR